MKELTLLRTESAAGYTVGQIGETGKKPICLTIELPWKNNAKKISCIPAGEYVLRKYESQKYKPALKVWDKDGKREVGGRTAILVHVGNYINFQGKSDSLGCILPVEKVVQKTESGIFASNSRQNMQKLFDFVGDDSVKFIIKNAENVKLYN